jgi:DnaJ-domain-containing protein 1
MFNFAEILRQLSENERRNQERFEKMSAIVDKFIEEVEQYKGLVSKVAEEFKALKDKLSGAVDEESWKKVEAVVAELDATNTKLEEIVTVKAPDPAPVVEEAAPAEPAPEAPVTE